LQYLDLDSSTTWDISDAVAELDRKDIELLWDESLELRYEARDYIIDNWDKSRYTNPNMD
jgi:hypothetical protein